MTDHAQKERPLAWVGLLGLGSMLAGALLCPPVLGALLAKDGTINNELVRLSLWPASALTILVGAAAVGLTFRGRVRSWIWGHRYRVIAGVVASCGLCGAGFNWYVVSINQVDLLSRLEESHPDGRKLLEIRRASGDIAALDALLDRSRARPSAVALLPQPLWDSAPEESRRVRRLLLDGKLGDADQGWVYRWSPGEAIEWRDLRGKGAFMLQRHEVLFELLNSPDTTELHAVIAFAIAYVDQWRAGNRVWPNWSRFAWNDDTTSHRIQAQIWLMDTLRKAGAVSREQERVFLTSLIQHADRLMDDAHYTWTTNHGMMQNAALLSIALGYPEFDQGGRWRDTALARTDRYVQESVTSRGASLELATGYHWFGMEQLVWFVAACELAGVSVPPGIEAGARKMIGFSQAMLQPDRSLPIIGDTIGATRSVTNWPFDRLPRWPEIASLKAAVTGSGPPNRPGAEVWPDAGYFILRTPAPSWTLEAALMVVFKAGPMSRAHAQHDALTVTLFGAGRPLLSGPGYPSYDLGAQRAVVIGTANQNTVSVDSRSQPLGGARITFADLPNERASAAELSVVQGESLLYRGVIHRRTVIHGVDAASVLLVDELSSDQTHDYQQHFRLASGVAGSVEDGLLRATWPERKTAGLRIETQVSADDQPLAVHAKLTGQTASYFARGSRVTFVTTLSVGEITALPRLDAQQRTVDWLGPRGRLSLRLPITGTGSYSWSATPPRPAEPAEPAEPAI